MSELVENFFFLQKVFVLHKVGRKGQNIQLPKNAEWCTAALGLGGNESSRLVQKSSTPRLGRGDVATGIQNGGREIRQDSWTSQNFTD